MRQHVVSMVVALALSWSTATNAAPAPPRSVPEGARFPVQTVFETAPTSVGGRALPPGTLPEGVHFPSGDIIGLPVVAMPDAPTAGVADDGTEILRWVLGSDVLFDFNKAEIRPDGEKDLTAFLQELRELQDFRLIVEGHTDSKGTHSYNLDLSQRRAKAVAAWLASTASALPRADILAFGETRPAAPNEKADGSDDPVGRQLNRRVEIVVRAATPTG